MKKAIIIYQSKTGITRRFAENLGEYLRSKDVKSKVLSIHEYNDDLKDQVDLVLLGCWTAGWMIMMQTPDRHWIRFATQLPGLDNKKVMLFTTYKLATGRMFKKMRQYLEGKSADISLELKSKNGKINDKHRQLIDALVG